MEVLANMVVVILQYISVWNQYAFTLNLYTSITTSIKLKNKSAF